MIGIWRIVMEAIIPLQISSIEVVKKVSKVKGVLGVDIRIKEVERKIEMAQITVTGNELDFDTLKKIIEDIGVVIQSVDRVSSGEHIE